MKKTNIIYSQFFYLTIFLSVVGFYYKSSYAQSQHNHSIQKTTSVNKVCNNSGAYPDLRCALAPSVLFDKQGRAWVVWVYADHVYVSQSNDKGQSFNAPVKVNSVPEKIYAKGENRPKIAFGPKNEIFISWTKKITQKRFSGDIRFSRSVDGGKHFSNPITVNDHRKLTSHRFDAMSVNQKGDIYIAWLDKRDLLAAQKAGVKYNGAALYYALSTDDGKTFRKNKKIADNTCQCCRVAMAIDEKQLPVIVWRHIFSDNVRDHGIVNFSKADHANMPLRLSYDNWKIKGCPHHGPAISVTDDGVYHTTWFNNAPESHGLFYANSKNRAANFSKPINFGDYKKSASHPHVLSIDERVYIVWKEFDGKYSSLNLMMSSDAGESWSEPKQVMKTAAVSDHPFLINDEENIYISWHRSGEEYRLIRVSI